MRGLLCASARLTCRSQFSSCPQQFLRTPILKTATRLTPSVLLSHRHYALPALAPQTSDTDQVSFDLSSRQDTQLIPGAYHLATVLDQVHSLLETDIGGADEWLRRVESTQEDLTRRRRSSIGVYGETLAAPRDVFSALLQDPLVDSAESRRALLQRHVDASTEVLSIRQADVPNRSPTALEVPSSWLRSANIDVQEIGSTDVTTMISQLLQNDIALLVVDPYHLLETPAMSKIAPILAEQGSLSVIVNGVLPPGSTPDSIRRAVHSQLQKLVPHDKSLPVICVQAERALRALDALTVGIASDTASTSRATAFDIFQQDYLVSDIGELQQELLRQVTSDSFTQIQTATSLTRLTIQHIEEIILQDREVIRNATYVVQQLRQEAERYAAQVKHASAANKGIEGGLVEGGVEHSMRTVQSSIEHLFASRWSWLGLIGRLRADEVGPEISSYLNQHFGRSLEQTLIFETGGLAQIQSSLSTSTDAVLQKLASHHHHTSSPLASPTLINHLSTLSLSIPPLDPSSLIEPVARRRQQLLQESVPRIQKAASRSVITTSIVASTSIAAAWVAYLPPFSIISGPTAVGLALLGSLFALSLGQRMWERAQSKFWGDWRRITSMLRGDLQSTLLDLVDTRLSAKPLAAADGLEKMISRRNHRLDDLHNKINGLREKL